jgi:hypothetical protein
VVPGNALIFVADRLLFFVRERHQLKRIAMFFQKAIVAAFLASTAFAQERKLKWFGINESGAEFGEKNFTGVYGKEYIWYDFDTIDSFMEEGMNMFRLNFRKQFLPFHTLASIGFSTF